MTLSVKKQALSIMLFIGLGLLMAYFVGAFNDKVEPHRAQGDPVSNAVQTLTLEAQETPIFETIPGTVRARQSTIISSRLLATINAIHVRAGDHVTVGDLLIELENEELKARVEMWRQQGLAIAVKLAQSQPQYERVKRLFDDGVSSQAALDKATADYQSHRAELASVTASQQEAQTQLAFSYILAPISGQVINRLAEPGELASPSQGLISLYNPNTMRIEANIRESLALGLHVGDRLMAKIPSAERTDVAIIEEIIPEAHIGTRSFLIKAFIADGTDLVPGLFARLQVPVGTEHRLYVPNDYVTELGQLEIVWVQSPAGPRKQIVRLGSVDEQNARVVISGLVSGDILVHPSMVTADKKP